MKLVDVHCHIEGEKFEGDLSEVIERARISGLGAIINSGTSPDANRKVLSLTKKYDIIKASFGIYPIDAIIKDFKDLADDSPREIKEFDYKDEINWIKENKNHCVSIGEVGLDFKVVKEHKDFEKIKEAQIRVFKDTIKLAKELDKPIVIHSRGAELECIELLEKHEVKKVLMHCFSGKKSLIKRIVDNGWYLSIPAVITRLLHFRMMAEIVPLNQILTETDAPYLAPVLGERSEPRDVAVTTQEIAKIKNLTEEEVKNQIWENAKKLFNF